MTKKWSGLYRSFALVGGLAWAFVICVILGGFLGTFVDSTFRTKSVFLIVGLIAGVIVGFWQCYRMIMSALRENERKQDDSK
ncbi:MAG: AtpZ/AtpI family protein [Planctomycetes bacterium]|nr:AtpZ/AtpI family protein [Planctomycetota bacterium]